MKSWSKYGFIVVLGIVLSMLFAGCIGQEEEITEVKVGVVYPLTGALAKPGTDARDAFILVQDKVNAEGGIKSLGGAELKFAFADSKGDAETAAAEAERLITEEKVVMVSGAYASSNTLTVQGICEEYEIPMINPESTSPALIKQGAKWFFRTTPDDDLFAQNFFEFLADLKPKYPGIPLETVSVVYENTLWGASMGELEVNYAKEHGYEVVLDLPYTADTPDVTPETTQIKAEDADILMLTSYVTDAILFTQAFKEYDVNPKIILATDVGYTHPDYFAAVGKDADYVINRENYAPDMKDVNPVAKEADDTYFAKFGKHFDGTSIRAYVGALLVADVLERAGSTDPEELRDTILATKWGKDKLPTAWDGIEFNPENGQNKLVKGIMTQTFDATPYTIWPWDAATRDVVFPMPTWAER